MVKAAIMGGIVGFVAGATFGIGIAAGSAIATAAGITAGSTAAAWAGAATVAVSSAASGQSALATTNVLTGRGVTEGLGNPMDMLRDATIGLLLIGLGTRLPKSSGRWFDYGSILNLPLTSYGNVNSRIQKPLFREGSANAGNTVASTLDDIPRYGSSWSGARTTKTLGILEVPGRGKVYLQSGVNGPYQQLQAGTGSGFNIYTRTHVEGHAVAIMRLEGVKSATLYINNVPCGACTQNLRFMVPHGSSLTIIGPNNYIRVYP